jgi:hypothetical protein
VTINSQTVGSCSVAGVVGSPLLARVTFATALANTNYYVQFRTTFPGFTDVTTTYEGKTTAKFDFSINTNGTATGDVEFTVFQVS